MLCYVWMDGWMDGRLGRWRACRARGGRRGGLPALLLRGGDGLRRVLLLLMLLLIAT